MTRQSWSVLIVAVLAGCAGGKVAPEVLKQYQGRTLYTCCNIHFEKKDINDANYFVGQLLPLGSPVQVEELEKREVEFKADGREFELEQKYGTEQESFEQYLNKILVPDDPNLQLAKWPPAVQHAVHLGQVERGMTRPQVLMSLGYPPTHRTAFLTDDVWTYWYNRWVTYQVIFNESGKVEQIVGGSAPTTNTPIQDAAAAVLPPASKKRR